MSNTQAMQNFAFGNATHVGLVRKANEDYFGSFDTPNGYVFLVCDGMGGHVGGAKASQIAVATIRDFLMSQTLPEAAAALKNAIIAANNAILQYASQNPDLKGMGSTCVAVLVQGSDVFYAHVGDSRIYLQSEGRLFQITKDHSFVQMLVDMGEISEQEAEHHPRKNEITNALGLPNMKPPDVCLYPIKAAKGDYFLLCSDGLTGMVANTNIEKVLNSAADLQQKASKLVEMANVAGGKDNITLQIIHFHNSEYKKTENYTDKTIPGETRKLKLPIILGGVALLIIGLIVGYFLWPETNKEVPSINKNDTVLPVKNDTVKNKPVVKPEAPKDNPRLVPDKSRKEEVIPPSPKRIGNEDKNVQPPLKKPEKDTVKGKGPVQQKMKKPDPKPDSIKQKTEDPRKEPKKDTLKNA